MIIEIRKTQFLNKGAELMLHAILKVLEQKVPNKKLVMAPRFGLNPYEKYSILGFHSKAWVEFKSVQWGYYANIIPKKLRDLFGIVTDNEIDVVLDAGGFEYTDFWGDKITIELANSSKKWKKQGTKLILLPQAFGPFSSQKIREAIKTIVENADLIYARDIISYNHLIEITGETPNLKISPDFTNLLEGSVPENFDSVNNRFCIIPNFRMIDKTSNDMQKKYVSFMKRCTQVLQDNNMKPYILIHEGEKDENLASEIIAALQNRIPIIKESNPMHIKGIIGTAEGLLSSRYHGLISGLSQAVPSFGTGWSHKYKMLFNDYGFEDGLVDLSEDIEISIEKIIKINDENARKFIQLKLSEKANEIKEQSKQMWNEVTNVINS